MNGTGMKGGAFGFRVSSINKVSSLGLFRKSSPGLTIDFPSLLIPSR